MCLCLGLLLWQDKVNLRTLWSISIIFLSGMFIEWVGVHTGFPFGSYSYGEFLGPRILEIPYIIGINWVMLVYITASISNWTTKNIIIRSIIGSALMVSLDILIEPNAAMLSFWYWEDGEIPLNNFIAWFGAGLLLHFFFQKKIKKTRTPKLALHIFLAQLIFFSMLSLLH